MKLTKIGVLKHCISLGLVGLGLAFGGCGGGNETQTVAPASSGKRGERCESRNDCGSGLACIGGICSKNDFPITANLKQCVPVECATQADCCGDKPLEAPTKCNAVESVCNTPSLTSCQLSTGYQTGTCSSSSECGGGVCNIPTGSACEGGLFNGSGCTSAADCPTDICDAGTCTVSSIVCTFDDDCTYNNLGVSSCEPLYTTGTCNCTNPAYDPADPICTDPDCAEGVCTLTCENELCVEDESCESDTDCEFTPGTPLCSDDGRCVRCLEDADCNEDAGEACNSENQCEKPCKKDEECPFLSECNSGECVEVGCKSNLQCVLWFASPGNDMEGSQDARQAECVDVPGLDHKQCRIPCEVDAQCGSDQFVCELGVCTFIGCSNNDDCRGAHPAQQFPSESHPWVTSWECRASEDGK